MRAGLRLAFLTALLAGACMPFGPVDLAEGRPASLGTTAHGALVGAVRLPAAGEHHRCYRGAGMRYGLPELVGLVERAAARVAGAYPGSILYVGDLSAARGGDEPGHASHESGRDVDLAFYAALPSGRPVKGFPVTRFDLFGVGLAEGGGRALAFDAARNWALVEALLADEGADVQWIFASDGLRATMLRWALDHGRDIALLERALLALRQPTDSLPHDDHFHVRIYCPPGSFGVCEDVGPVWPWIAARREERPARRLYDADANVLGDEGS